jgi:asparagine synthase (glutamine-hydrolysing)
MCGIAGFTFPTGRRDAARSGPLLRRMTASLGHRGPDAHRAMLLEGVALGHARLAIVDPAGGAQPMRDPATGVTVVFNGEIFNHVELRERLSRHAFRTRSDTEVILAGYLAEGIACVRSFNGQFAFALWDPRSRELWLARDRFGIAPLFYVPTPDGLAFASEAKALFAGGWARPALDPAGLKQTLQLWAPVAPRTAFEGIRSLPPRSVGRLARGTFGVRRYWDLDLEAEDGAPAAVDRAVEEMGWLLEDAVRLRLRADVPVAAYLSGGLDSSVICAIAQRALGGTLSTYSVRFPDRAYDERAYQDVVARGLGTRHVPAEITEREIGELLPASVRHAEQVVIRSAPAPLLRLSDTVRRDGTKVVLTGEGADEVFLGYDLFKETKVRHSWGSRPDQRWRAAPLARLHGAGAARLGGDLLRDFYGIGLDRLDAPEFSHLVRWSASGRIGRFFSAEFAARTDAERPIDSLVRSLPPRVRSWRPLARAQYIEMETLLSGYLLSAQGDRMLMANGVEGRFPFLDHRLVEYAARLPDRLKLRGFREKYLLRRYAARWLPRREAHRPKYPYRAPVAGALVGAAAPSWSAEVFAPESIRALGVFDPEKVRRLVLKVSPRPADASEADAMALVAIATTQLLGRAFASPEHIGAASLAAVELTA